MHTKKSPVIPNLEKTIVKILDIILPIFLSDTHTHPYTQFVY